MRTSIFGIAIAFLTSVAFSATPCAGTTHVPSGPTAEYVEALHVANLFLTAWVERSPESGLALMSARLSAADADSARPDLRSGLPQYLSGLSNPHHEAFEIAAGRGRASDRVVFPVRLFEAYTNEPNGFAYSDSLGLVLQAGEWRVDRLPRTYYPD